MLISTTSCDLKPKPPLILTKNSKNEYYGIDLCTSGLNGFSYSEQELKALTVKNKKEAILTNCLLHNECGKIELPCPNQKKYQESPAK